ncbi:MAG TPA: SWIM zinc finger family protein [Candidatus Xenobia bacterium]|jgi:uncharacterized Zn finger protein
MSYGYDGGWAPYVSVAERRKKAQREMEKLAKKGHPVSPVIIEGRTIATTFWGKAWCENLEKYHDFANRLPRGRTYVRNGSVVDLQIAPLKVDAQVSGSSMYRVSVAIAAVSKAHWQALCRDCVGGIDSLVELLQGRFSKGIMERLCQQREGLFPTPSEIKFSCSCPDYAVMCKHVAAVLYGIGARLDNKPELLFRLRSVDEKDLFAHVDASVPLSKKGPKAGKILKTDDISDLFGLEMAGDGCISGGVVSKKVASGKTRPKGPMGKPKASTTAGTPPKAGGRARSTVDAPVAASKPAKTTRVVAETSKPVQAGKGGKGLIAARVASKPAKSARAANLSKQG